MPQAFAHQGESSADQAAIDALAATFFAAFASRVDGPVDLAPLRALFIPQAVIVKTCGPNPAIYDLDAFLAPREILLNGGTLKDFSEWETDARTEIFGAIAQRWSGYAKRGVLNGVAFSARGRKTVQCVRMPEGWRISAVAWDDEREGVAWA